MKAKVNKMYEFAKQWCANANQIPEKELIRLIGEEGIVLLTVNKLLIPGEVINGKKTYILK